MDIVYGSVVMPNGCEVKTDVIDKYLEDQSIFVRIY